MKNDKQTSEDYLHWVSTVSCLFAIYNLWPLQLDCVCVGYGYVWGLGVCGSASE